MHLKGAQTKNCFFLTSNRNFSIISFLRVASVSILIYTLLYIQPNLSYQFFFKTVHFEANSIGLYAKNLKSELIKKQRKKGRNDTLSTGTLTTKCN